MSTLIASITNWYCPACGSTDQTSEPKPHVRYHICPKTGGLTTPFVRKGISAKIEVVERMDYVGKELVRYNDAGRPVMALVTTRDDGNDVMVFAPTAQGKLKEDE